VSTTEVVKFTIDPLSMEDEGENRPIRDLTEEERQRMVQSLQSYPRLGQLEPSEWEACCQFFKVDPRHHERHNMFLIGGLRVGLFPHQAFAVYWMLLQSTRDLRGVFLADDMGLGKTMTVIAF